MDRRSYKFEGVVTALASISHIGDTFGATARFRREKIAQPDGSVQEVPVYSGNGLRGALRDAGMRYMLDRLGLHDNALPLSAFYFLFSGGALSKQAGRGIDVDLERRLRDMIPLVSVFGGATGNQIAPGRLDLGKLYPICQETMHLLPESARPVTAASFWDYLQEEAYTRKDDAKDHRLVHYLTDDTRLLLDAEQADKRRKLGTDEDIDRDAGQHQQMRYYVETLCAGTRLTWRICLYDVTDLEFEAFASCLLAFSRRPVLGGKGSVGHGQVQIAFDRWLTIDPRVTLADATAVDLPLGSRYHEHLDANRDAITDLLRSVQ